MDTVLCFICRVEKCIGKMKICSCLSLRHVCYFCVVRQGERRKFFFVFKTNRRINSSSFFMWFINKSNSMLLPINKHQQTNLLATTAESTRAQEIAGVSLQIKPLNSSPCIQHGPNIYQRFIAAKLFASAQHLQSILSLERGLPTGGLSAIQRVLCVRGAIFMK